MNHRLPRIEIEPKEYVIRFYDKDPDRYSSSLVMTVDGDEGRIHTLNGTAFFKLIPMFHKAIFPPGVKYVSFIMMERTLLLLQATAHELYNFNIGRSLEKDGRTFYRVEITLK